MSIWNALQEARPRSLIRVAALAIWLLPGAAGAIQNQVAEGEKQFQTLCFMCHTIGGGRLVGPDLLGVEQRHSEEWIIDFVQHSQQLVQSGDPDAVALFEQYGIVMPDAPLTDDQVRSVLAYTRESRATTAGQTGTAAPATEAQILLGQQLFQGTVRLANGGPTCNSCHEVTNDAVIGGGALAIELTTVFTRLGGPGVRAILGSPPFPVMQRAYAGQPLTDEEVVALVGFLEKADAEQSLHQPRDYGIKLLGTGVAGAALLLALYSALWRGRKRGSVNQMVFDRQIRSTWQAD